MRLFEPLCISLTTPSQGCRDVRIFTQPRAKFRVIDKGIREKGRGCVQLQGY